MYLVVGGDSEIGAATAEALRQAGQPAIVTTRRRDRSAGGRASLDLATLGPDWMPPAGVEAACIFAAVARLAACQADPQATAHINCRQTILLTERLVEAGIYTLYLSTNQVFDGSAAQVPADAPACPVSEYGRQKARTEERFKALMAEGAPAGILRLAKVVSPGMPLLAGWRAELTAGRPIRAFRDMPIAPTPIDMVADAIALMLRHRDAVVAQLTGPQDMSYSEVARLVARHVGADEQLVHAASARESAMPAGATPEHTTLDSGYLKTRYGLSVPAAAAVILKTALRPDAPG